MTIFKNYPITHFTFFTPSKVFHQQTLTFNFSLDMRQNQFFLASLEVAWKDLSKESMIPNID